MWLVGLDGVLLKANRTGLALGDIEAEQVVGHCVVETVGWQFFSQEQEHCIREDSDKYVSISVDCLIRDIQTLIRPTFPASISIKTALPTSLT